MGIFWGTCKYNKCDTQTMEENFIFGKELGKDYHILANEIREDYYVRAKKMQNFLMMDFFSP